MTTQHSIEKACKRIAPTWSLENSIAVNPFLGLSDLSFEEAARILKYRGGINLYMPLSFYLNQVALKEITVEDIKKALGQQTDSFAVDKFLDKSVQLAQKQKSKQKSEGQLTIVEKLVGKDLSELMITQISGYLASYFKLPDDQDYKNLFPKWKKYASIDLLPELTGVAGFRERMKKMPDTAESTIFFVLEKLNIPGHLTQSFLHSIFLQIIGWSSYCAGLDWQNKLYGRKTAYLKEMLGIILSWVFISIQCQNGGLRKWTKEFDSLESTLSENQQDKYLSAQAILQDALDFSYQRKLFQIIQVKSPQKIEKNRKSPIAQMVFCIDVRSEEYRRNVEAINEQIDTIGFAGFFGFPVQYNPINHTHGKNQCPALIPSGPVVFETTKDTKGLEKFNFSKSYENKLKKIWSAYKTGPVASFSFVSALGLFFLPKLISDSFLWTRPTPNPKDAEFGSILSGKRKLDVSQIPFNQRLQMATSALKAMGLRDHFAPFVLITGHGASSVNNPHASGLDCGACGGNSGEINAITAQLILNGKKIREGLQRDQIYIPETTYFLACLHNTTTDDIKILDSTQIPPSHRELLAEIENSLLLASRATRKNRSSRLIQPKVEKEVSVYTKAKDWAEVRPEWGLVGCHTFIIAPRSRTIGKNFEGRAFLHSYDHKRDTNFNILETIMTAPMIVTSWINLQYYASTTDNNRMGAGNKTLHNITAGIGVLEGSGGDLRIGLPIQSVHNGQHFQHLPIRLKVVVEAPETAVVNIINKHQTLKDLVVNNWISIFTLDDDGKLTTCFSAFNEQKSNQKFLLAEEEKEVPAFF